MAQDVEIKIKAAVEGAQAAQTLGQLRKALTDLQAVAEETEIGSTQFQNLQTQIANTTNQLAQTSDRLGDVGDKLRTLTGTPVERLNASFGLLKESIFNLDIDKAKIAVDGLVNSFTPLGPNGAPLTGLKAMGPVLGNLGSGVASLGQTFVALGRTLLMNPIFLLAATITAIVAAVVVLLNKMGLLKPIMDAIGAAVTYVSDAFNNLTEAIGLSTAASDKHLEKIQELGELERDEINRTYQARVAVASQLEGLDSLQIRQIEKVTGFYLQQDKTREAIAVEREKKIRESLANEIKEYQDIQAKNGKLNDEQKKNLKDLEKQYEETAQNIVAIETARLKKVEDLEKQNQLNKIANIQNAGERAKAQRDFEVQQAQSTRDRIAILLQQEKTATVENQKLIRREIDALTQQRQLEEAKAAKEYNEKLQQIYRDAAAKTEAQKKKAEEDERKRIQKGLDDLTIRLEIERDKTKEGTKARLEAEVNLIDQVYKYKSDNQKILQLDDLRLQKDFITNSNKKVALEEDYAKKSGEIQLKANQEKIETVKLRIAEETSFERSFDMFKIAKEDELSTQLFNLEKSRLELTLKLRKEQNDLTKEEELRLLQEIATLTTKEEERREKVLQMNLKELDEWFSWQSSKQEAYYKKDFETYLTFDKRKVERTKELGEKRLQILESQRSSDERALLAAFLKENEITIQQYDADSEAQKNFSSIKSGNDYKYAQKRIEIEKKTQEEIAIIRKKEADDALTISQNGLNAIQGVSDAYFAIKMNKAKGNAVQEEKLARKQFEVNKAFQVGAAIIDGFRAVQTSLAFAPLVIGPVPNPAGIANLAFTLITSASNIAKILATQYQSKSFSPAGGGAPSGGGAAVSAPTAPTFSPGQFFGLGGQAPVNVGVGGPNTVGQQRVFVVESDITSAQRRVTGIEQRAEIQ